MPGKRPYIENPDFECEGCSGNFIVASCPRHGHLVPKGLEKKRGATPERLREMIARREKLNGRVKKNPGRPRTRFTREEVRQATIDMLMPRALQVLEEQLYSKDERVSQNAAIKVMEYVKGKPTQTVKTEGEQIHTIRYESAAWSPDQLDGEGLIIEDEPPELPAGEDE